ncbi:MAG: hypothetical protein JRF65_10680 [Deltaproteobacteria bacterium]|nr:hypothetical protein [Deltaproteobacteria bacterium]
MPVKAGLNSATFMVPEGEFQVLIFADDGWRDAGTLGFDRFLREMPLTLGSLVPASGPVRLRLIQKGGSAAHVDAVLLGGKPPTRSAPRNESLARISSKDLDVLEAFKADWVLNFSQTDADRTLRLTARIEGDRKNEIPFYFPPNNLYGPLHERSGFYVYSLHSNEKKPGARNENAGPLAGEPLFRAYSRAASGHPSGYTYGWVADTDSNLLVRIDFTPDNTMDGDKDYASVFVNTLAGLKVFRVSQNETAWGRPSFTDTEKAAYRHKTYDFKIPLREIGISDRGQGADIQLAFAAYGTASPGDYVTDMAFDYYYKRYLAVIDRYGNSNIEVYGQVTDCNGAPIRSKLPLGDKSSAGSSASVAYDRTNKRYLAVWMDWRNGPSNSDIYGQFVGPSGQLERRDGTAGTENFTISNAAGNQFDPAIAYDTINGRFFIVWMDERNVSPWTTGRDIYGQIIYSNGAMYGTLANVNFPVCNESEEQRGAEVAYSIADKRFLVAWQDDRNSTGPPTPERDIYGQLVGETGKLFNTASNVNFAVCTAAEWQSPPQIAYGSENDIFMLAWTDYRNSTGYENGDVYGQVVNGNGTLSGGNIAVSNSTDDQSAPSLDFNPATGKFLTVWWDDRAGGTGQGIYGRFLDSTGALSGTDFSITAGGLDPGEYGVSIAANPYFFSYMLAFDMTEGTLPDIGFMRVGPPCADGFKSELAVDFGAWGVWDYDGINWISVTATNPQGMGGWAGGLAMDFGNLGLWNYDNGGWQAVSIGGSEGMAGWQGGLALDFGALGLWNYDGITLVSLSPANAVRMTGWAGGLAVDLGSMGLWNFDGMTWQTLSGSGGLAAMAGWFGGLALDYVSLGVWTYNGTDWNAVSATGGTQGMAGWTGGLALDYGNLGLWSFDGYEWLAIGGGNTDRMVGWTGGLALDYGALGLWNFNGMGFDSLSAVNPDNMTGAELIGVIY